jgi:hypothetical protein
MEGPAHIPYQARLIGKENPDKIQFAIKVNKTQRKNISKQDRIHHKKREFDFLEFYVWYNNPILDKVESFVAD